MATSTGFNSRNAFVNKRGSYSSKNIVKSRWSVHLRFGWHSPETGVQHCLWPPATTRQGRYGAAYSAQSLSCWCTAGRTKWNCYRAARAGGSMAQTWWCIEFTWNLSPGGFARSNPLRFITCHGTIPMPTSWRTTFGIHCLHPACGRRERQERCCACGVE